MDGFQMLINDGNLNLVTLDEPQIKIVGKIRDEEDDQVESDPLCMELTPSERAALHQPQPLVQPVNVPTPSSTKTLLLVKTYPLFRGGKVGQVVNQNVVEVPSPAVPALQPTLPVVTQPAQLRTQTTTQNKLMAQPSSMLNQATKLRDVISVLLSPPSRASARGRGRPPGPYFQKLATGPPHDEAQGSSCQCVSCMKMYFQKLYKISPEQCGRERSLYARKLRREYETPEQVEWRRAADREQKRKWKKTLAPEKREILLTKGREAQRKYYKKLSEENREFLLAKGREAQRKRCKKLSEEKREIMLAKGRERDRRARKALTAEKREIMLAKGRERARRAREARAEETREALLANECEFKGENSEKVGQDSNQELQQDVPAGVEMGEEVKEEVQTETDEDPYEEDIEEAEETGQLSSRSGSQMRRRPKYTIETLRLEVQKRNALSKLRRLAATPEQRERRRDMHRRARANRKLEKEKLGYFVPRQHLTIEQKIEQIAALEEAMKREEEEEKKFIDSYKYDEVDHGQDPDGHVSCTVCSVLVLKEDMGFHMKYHAEQDKKKSRQTNN